ncbi:hypothetical protein EXIGLDRAFT_752599 [Exidia glandulosa HHB12029]|uniref:Thioredoxin-like fold domain-containing protein n=1 Tax=Exidia glandulosa HHB12029 TaxID=1314781 RepID=A0A165EFM9_EXIGL|nr:hypothetical protein EXIGLDRAFT_752599 [Exidia glandulosa HHB12029]
MAVSLRPSLRVFGNVGAPNTLELFIDFACPRSKQLVESSITGPSTDATGTTVTYGALAVLFYIDYDIQNSVKVIVRPFIQAAHLGSKVTHEVALAVLSAHPEHFWGYATKVFAAQDTDNHYFDIRVDEMTPTNLRAELCNTVFASALTSTSVAKADRPAIVETISTLVSQKSVPNLKPPEKNIIISDTFKQVVQKCRHCPASVPGVAAWNGTLIPDFSPLWGQLEWGSYLKSKLL